MEKNITLFKTRVSIITIPRDDYWLFSHGILQLLHKISDSYDHSYYNSLDDSSDDDYYQFDDESSDSEIKSDKSSSRKSGSINRKYDSMSNSITLNNSIQSQLNNLNINEENYNEQINNEINDNNNNNNNNNNNDEEDDDGLFFHLAFTPEEVTVMCSIQFVDEYFKNSLELSKKLNLGAYKIPESFLMIQVISDGYNIGKRVLELTEPIGKNDIPLFFISNYFSDIVLVPSSSKDKIVEILDKMNNENNHTYKSEETIINDNDNDDTEDLEAQTFKLFKNSNIHPKIHSNVKLLLTGARSGDSMNVLKTTTEALSKLNTTIPKKDETTHIKTNDLFPPYFAITRTPTEEIGLLLPQSSNQLRKLNYKDSNLLGSKEDYFLPLVINLKELPIDLKGIVAGVALRLLKVGVNEMSYLSLGKSGVVMIPGEFLDSAKKIL